MISILFQEIKKNRELETAVRSAASVALESQSGEITFILCNDEFIHVYNQQYRGVDRSTDVLSFSSDEIDPETGEKYLGDVIISVDHAQKQALEVNHPLSEEVSMLAIHGVLHLLGFDHSTNDEKTEMWAKQGQLLAQLGIKMDKFSGDK